MRTSHSHPLQIADVRAGCNMGRIGITFCPGKKQPSAMTGGWDRDVCIDVAAIEAWGASAVVTLIEDHEIASLKVEKLGDTVRSRHLDWLHLPIIDVSTPCSRFDSQWQAAGEGLRARLRDGFDVVVHCKGGLGRAGMTAARLLIELGVGPEVAVAQVRKARPGAIETSGQESYVRKLTAVPEAQPLTSAEAIADRAQGALLGLAIGDAVGTTLEFKARDTYEPLTDMVGGGPFRLKAGEWTDDTAMALALADSLANSDDLDEADLMQRFCRWQEKGEYSCTGTCFDIGITTRQALERFRKTGNPIAGSSDPMSAGNGSLMRLSPVAIRFWQDREKLRDVAARQSRTTHAAPEAVDACIAYAEVLADAIAGQPRSRVMRPCNGEYAGSIRPIIQGSWRGKRREQIRSSGYVAHSLEAALWCVGRTADFRSAVLLAANLGEDADTTAAITGQLAGALYGSSGIPSNWKCVAWAGHMQVTAASLLKSSAPAL